MPNDHPVVAPDYAARRLELAHAIGLGRKAVEELGVIAEAVVAPVANLGQRGGGS